jgi:CheY-like chemotaxis protein
MNSLLAPIKSRWLLVDDNADILRVLAAVVKTITDAEIETFCSPVEALAAFAAAPDKYELVITDYEMPGMDGVELCRRLRALIPAQMIFLATGSGFITEAGAQQAGFGALLSKPFPFAVLRSALATKCINHEFACAA